MGIISRANLMDEGVVRMDARDNRIDILRFIGLAMIVLAHVNPPYALSQLRNFDVPLMVLLSGMSFGLSYRPGEAFASYVYKRIKRLVFPVWIFLTGYFAVLFLIDSGNSDLTLAKIAGSYLLVDGIGYMWIIKVFLLVALVSPLLHRFNEATGSAHVYLLLLVAGIGTYELVRYLTLPYISTGAGFVVSQVSHYLIPYAMVFALGLRLIRLTHTQLLLAIAFFGVVFAAFAMYLYTSHGYIVPTQRFKYPPGIYYLSYAMVASLVLWLLIDKIAQLIHLIKIQPLVLFIARNSIWIYLWHIPLVKIVQADFITKYCVVFGVAILITFIQVWWVQKLAEKTTSARAKKRFEMLFTG
ncbi:acyltransferase [Simiduia sp. 21SJ11W-1]|uniref:acyltransferase family protein n=1 Tax=Simiduia sp. 21SJ11W-1 TaxID=2909669 RepID=UPI00209EC4F5|nr:acyltransferase [Simiduia sp. 21SJ11W-1]UTA47595.1 acyltransferase [Simiduia sp. 21SJ11W-1]